MVMLYLRRVSNLQGVEDEERKRKRVREKVGEDKKVGGWEPTY